MNNSCINLVRIHLNVYKRISLINLQQTALANYVAIMNVLTEVSLIVLPMVILRRLQVDKRKKLILTLVFMGRFG